MIMAGGNEEDILEVNDLLSIMGTVQYAGPFRFWPRYQGS